MKKHLIEVEVVPYDPTWPTLFEEEAKRIKEILGENCLEIYHVGSTSVPGLAAKPIIDIVPVVKDICAVDIKNEQLEELGYTAKGELGMLFRRFFQKGPSPFRTHHLHVWEAGNPEIEKHLLFRDYLIQHPDVAQGYADLKHELAKKHPENSRAYSLSKDDLIREILDKTGYSGLSVVEALTDREWEAVSTFRQKYFFDKVPVSDPYTWTFDHTDHVHLTLYKGAFVIGYAHIQLWPHERAALRIIVIDEPHRNKGIGGHFLKIIERWLNQQKGVKKLHTQSSPEAHKFYRQHGYTEMPFDDPDGYESCPQDIDMGKEIR